MGLFKFAGRGVLLGALFFAGCEPTGSGPVPEPTYIPPTIDDTVPKGKPQTDAGTVRQDAGVTTTVDAGTIIDAGSIADSGTSEQDAGETTVDAGTMSDAGYVDAGLPPTSFPSIPNWTFYGPQHGLPMNVNGVSADEGGNIWVAGGEAGLFVLRPGNANFERFTMAEGLRPYGYMADGSEPPGSKYLNVLTVQGGPPGTVFVGYKGKGVNVQCEGNFDTAATADPSIYKSGDADRVTLNGNGISVVHYDIWTGPGNTTAYPDGREKLCDIYSILWDKAAGVVWFGGNHGFALGLDDYAGNVSCNGVWSCSGVMEHIHPLVTGYWTNAKTTAVTLSGGYRAMALYENHDVFVGADIRSTRFKFGTNGGLSSYGNAYWASQPQSESDTSNHFDIWPDLSNEPSPAERKDDAVFGVARAADGSFWVGSAAYGLAHVSESGVVLGNLQSELVAPHVSRVTLDPADNSIWAGARHGGGISRLQGGTVTKYGWNTFGPLLSSMPVTDIQVMDSGSNRKMLIGFDAYSGKPGAVGIYSGN